MIVTITLPNAAAREQGVNPERFEREVIRRIQEEYPGTEVRVLVDVGPDAPAGVDIVLQDVPPDLLYDACDDAVSEIAYDVFGSLAADGMRP